MKRLSGLHVLFLLGNGLFWFSSSSHSETIEHALDRVYKEHESQSGNYTVDRLVEWDGQLRGLIEAPWKENERWIHQRYWKPEYKKIGLGVSVYCECIVYTGQLLVEAHKLDPLGPYRRYTLYSTILGYRNADGLGEMPNVPSALQYLEEFPDGPFVEGTYQALGEFYDDLFKALRARIEAGSNDVSDIANCFARYMDSRSYEQQLTEAQEKALFYYAKVLEINPKHRQVKKWAQDMRKGRPLGWHYCGD